MKLRIADIFIIFMISDIYANPLLIQVNPIIHINGDTQSTNIKINDNKPKPPSIDIEVSPEVNVDTIGHNDDGEIEDTCKLTHIVKPTDGDMEAISTPTPISKATDGDMEAISTPTPISKATDGYMESISTPNPILKSDDENKEAISTSNPISTADDGNKEAISTSKPISTAGSMKVGDACSLSNGGRRYPNPSDCKKYFYCNGARIEGFNCNGGTCFNPASSECGLQCSNCRTTPTPSKQNPSSGTSDVTFTFVNRCNQDLWMGAEGRSDSRPSFVWLGLNFYTPNNGGWYLPEGGTSEISVPYDFTAGRFWARTGCTGTPNVDFHCETGDCGPWIECSQGNVPRGGAPPATLAEITLNGWDNFDYYDISLVDGFNLPMEIAVETYDDSKDNPNEFWCISPQCMVDINSLCPSELSVKGSTGTVACYSGCSKFNTDQYCCRGVYGQPATCITEDWPVNYADDFYKSHCPQGYSYAWDHNTADFVCRNTNYKIYFC